MESFTMKAVVLKEPKTLELRHIPMPVMTDPGHVIIKVEACGICGSDIRYWAGENPWAMHTLGKHVDNPPNMIMGHEFAGIVEKVNSMENEKWLGQRVGVQSYRVCGTCRFCKTGRENLCRNTIHIGHAQGWGTMEYYPGAYAEYCLGWGDLLHPIPDHVSFSQAAMADILCVAIHVVGRTRLYDQANVLCIGGGPAGLSIAQIARHRGARRIIISDPSPAARKVLARYPAFEAVDPSETDLKTAAGSTKFAAVFDSVGTADSISAAIPFLEEGGTYVNLAVHSVPIEINALALGSERSVTTSSNASYADLKEAFILLRQGSIEVDPWITHRFPLEGFNDAFDLLTRSPKAAYKIVFEPWSEC